MSDSLDDFFAKKDKKRSKDKGKTVLTAEALVRELEEGSRQVEYTARKDIKTSAAIELLGLDTDDADWRDFDDLEKRDYTGLKIKEISLQDQNDEEMRRLQADQAESKEQSTVWNSAATTATAAASTTLISDVKPSDEHSGETKPDSSSEKPKKDQSETETTKKVYVPPGQRNMATNLEPSRMPRRNINRVDAPPQIDNDKEFPGLD